MNKTKIQYLDYTWNPLAMRCTPVSAGCKNCWHLRMADRLAKNPRIPETKRLAYRGEIGPILVGPRFEEPLRVKKPARIGVQFMGDLFHRSIPFGVICSVFDVMNRARWHTFLVLTKRPERMLEWIRWQQHETGEGYLNEGNVQIGVSVENQQAADERIPLLLQIPAAVRFVSVEPMLESVNIESYLWAVGASTAGPWRFPSGRVVYTGGIGGQMISGIPANELHWVIAGAESGPGARPMNEDWVRDLRDQCVAGEVPFFLKQIVREGKKIPMPELDGLVWDQMPVDRP